MSVEVDWAAHAARVDAINLDLAAEAQDRQQRLERACDEIIALKHELRVAQASYAEVSAALKRDLADSRRCNADLLHAVKSSEYKLNRTVQDYRLAWIYVRKMHAAAFGGEDRQPVRGDVEDIEDLYQTCMFWQRAAEQALRMWDRSEDRADEMQRIARSATHMAQAYISLCDYDDEEVDNDCGQAAIWLEQIEQLEEQP